MLVTLPPRMLLQISGQRLLMWAKTGHPRHLQKVKIERRVRVDAVQHMALR